MTYVANSISWLKLLGARLERVRQRHFSEFMAFAVRIASAILVFALQVFLARKMVLEDYGTFITVTTWMIVIAGFSVLGFGESAVRFLPRYAARQRWADARAYFRFGFFITVGSTTLIAALVHLAGWTFLDPGDLRTTVLLVTLGLPFAVADFFLEGVGRAMGWFKLAIVPTYILQPVVVLAILSLAVLNGATITTVMACVVFIAVYASVTLLKGGLITWKIWQELLSADGNDARNKRSKSWRSHWLRAALPLMAVYGLDDSLVYSDVLLLGILGTPEDVGIYMAGVRCLAIANFIYYAFMLVAARKFSLSNALGDTEKLQSEVQEASRMTLLLTTPAVALIVISGYPLLGIFGKEFVAAWPAMTILGVGMVIRASVGQAFDLLAVLGHSREIFRVSVVCLVANIVLSVALIPILGMVGAALSTAFAMTLRAVGLARTTRKVTGFSVLAFR